MDGAVASEGADLALGGVVATSRQDGRDGEVQGLSRRDTSGQTERGDREMAGKRIGEIGSELQVAGILAGLAVDQARIAHLPEVGAENGRSCGRT